MTLLAKDLLNMITDFYDKLWVIGSFPLYYQSYNHNV